MSVHQDAHTPHNDDVKAGVWAQVRPGSGIRGQQLIQMCCSEPLQMCSLTCSPQCLLFSKRLIRSSELERLHAVNDAEVERLVERWTSDECFDAIMSFFQNKSKL